MGINVNQDAKKRILDSEVLIDFSEINNIVSSINLNSPALNFTENELVFLIDREKGIYTYKHPLTNSMVRYSDYLNRISDIYKLYRYLPEQIRYSLRDNAILFFTNYSNFNSDYTLTVESNLDISLFNSFCLAIVYAKLYANYSVHIEELEELNEMFKIRMSIVDSEDWDNILGIILDDEGVQDMQEIIQSATGLQKLEARINALELLLTGYDSDTLDDIYYKLEDLSTKHDNTILIVNDNKTRIQSLEDVVDSMPDFDTIETEISNLKLKNQELDSELDALSTLITDISTDVDSLITTIINPMKTSLDATVLIVEDLVIDQTSLENRLLIAEEQVGNIDEYLNDLDNEISSIASSISSINSSISSLSNRVQTLENSTAELNYTNATPMPTAFGGLKAGTTFLDVPIQTVLDSLLYPYQDPAFTSFLIDGKSSDNFEVGYAVLTGDKTFTWTTSNKNNIVANSILLNAEAGLADNGTKVQNIAEIKKTAVSTHTFTIRGTNTANINFSRNIVLNWKYKLFYGVSPLSVLTDDNIKSLSQELATSKNKSLSYDCSGGKYFYLAYPSSFGDHSAVTVNGLAYNDYTLTKRSFVNQYGVSIPYNIYRSNNILNGVVTVNWN